MVISVFFLTIGAIAQIRKVYVATVLAFGNGFLLILAVHFFRPGLPFAIIPRGIMSVNWLFAGLMILLTGLLWYCLFPPAEVVLQKAEKLSASNPEPMDTST